MYKARWLLAVNTLFLNKHNVLETFGCLTGSSKVLEMDQSSAPLLGSSPCPCHSSGKNGAFKDECDKTAQELQLLCWQDVALSPGDGAGDTLVLLSEVLKAQIPHHGLGLAGSNSRGWKSSWKTKLLLHGAVFKPEAEMVFVPTQGRGVGIS